MEVVSFWIHIAGRFKNNLRMDGTWAVKGESRWAPRLVWTTRREGVSSKEASGLELFSGERESVGGKYQVLAFAQVKSEMPSRPLDS